LHDHGYDAGKSFKKQKRDQRAAVTACKKAMAEEAKVQRQRGRPRLRKSRTERLSKANSDLTQHRKRPQYANYRTKNNTTKRLRKRTSRRRVGAASRAEPAPAPPQDDVAWIQMSLDRKVCMHVCISTAEDLEMIAFVGGSTASLNIRVKFGGLLKSMARFAHGDGKVSAPLDRRK
jgi:hypothetical protein